MGVRIAIIIPVYNEEQYIGDLLRDLHWNKRDIIVIDDGSQDRSGDIASEMAVLLKHKRNFGKGYAHRTGFEYAIAKGYDYVITMDGDRQHDPKEITKFTNEINKNKADIIIGTRRRSPFNMPLIRYLTNLVTSFVVSFLAHKTIKDAQSGYRALSTRVLRGVHLTTSNFQTESEILIKAARLGYRIGSVPISTIYREEKSKMRPFIDTVRFVVLAVKSIFYR
ncbi:MAG: glycosyltransferase family 2 protein [bacterium]|nr:glycosyltransferase family 2 protein [bacterium]